MRPPKNKTAARVWQDRCGGKGNQLSQADIYSSTPAAATIPSPFCADRVAVVIRIGDRLFAIGTYPDRHAALAALRAVAA